MNTPWRRQQEVVIKGISMSVGAMVIFFAKMAVAAIPAILILLLTVVPAAAVLRKWVAEDGLEKLGESSVSKINSVREAYRSASGQPLSFTDRLSLERDDLKPRRLIHSYSIAFGKCADSARKLFGIAKNGTVSNVSQGGPQVLEKLRFWGEKVRFWGAGYVGSAEGDGTRILFSCDVSRHYDAASVIGIRRIPR